MARLFLYVGPEAIRVASVGAPAGTRIGSAAAAAEWARQHARGEGGWATYVVDSSGALWVAPRRSEHVACAAGGPVRAAGELRFDGRGEVIEVSNNSTGYCPAEDCWPEIQAALEAAALPHPGGLTFVAVFRRCPRCQHRNLVKDGWFACALCEAELPTSWNFELLMT